MIRKFCRDIRGNYALITVITMIPLMGGLALAVDYTDLLRQKQNVLNALDAAGIATALKIVSGASDDATKTYAKDFFETNLTSVDPADAALTVTLPNNNTGGGTLKMCATLTYHPYFLPAAAMLIGRTSTDVKVSACSEIRLKNTLEVALVLDNSGSMTQLGHGSNEVRFTLLKKAAKQLVDQLAGQAQTMKQVSKPVQFSLVPFAASVNVGPANKDEAWMDTTGVSPLDQENLDWSTLTSANSPNQWAQKSGNYYYAKGTAWDATQLNQVLTRFSIYKWMKRISSCTKNSSNVCTSNIVYAPIATWGGCVESRPYPYNIQDTAASTSTPATMFVPMFAPDETDNTESKNGHLLPANNNWHADITTSTNNATRQKYMPKYFNAGVGNKVTPAYGSNAGPNASCSTTAITPLKDVSLAAGATAVKKAIDDMVALGATNVPEGMAWGWRTLSHAAPFTDGRPEAEKGNDKVLIVLTDGANTYYTPDSVSAQNYSGTDYQWGGNDLAGSKALYSSLGYLAYPGQTKPFGSAYTYGRPFLGTSSDVSKSDYSNPNYSKAMNEHFATLCNNAKTAGVIVMTIALDLDASKTAEAAQMTALKTCSSDSRFRKNPNDPSKPAKLFWNSTGATLSDDFKEIGNELSNLRIVG